MPKFTLEDILKNSNSDLVAFTDKAVKALEERIIEKNGKPYVVCLKREKEIQLKPEEVVRQLYVEKLQNEYGYSISQIKLEHPIRFGRDTSKRADIVVFDKDHPEAAYIIVEVKKPTERDGKSQLRTYCHATGAPISVWTNGNETLCYNRIDPNYFEPIRTIPRIDETLIDVLSKRFTWRNLVLDDKVLVNGKELQDIIRDMENEVLANAGVDVFEEVFKLIFSKLYDEMESKKDKDYLDRQLKRKLRGSIYQDLDALKDALEGIEDDDFRAMAFRNKGDLPTKLKKEIQSLFDAAKEVWTGVFSPDSKIELSPSHLAVCVSYLQDVKLFNSNLQVIDEAFEYLVNKSSKGEKGQYFTPRHVIDMCVKMLNPQRGEYMIDTAAGSCGFPVHTIFQITDHLFKNAEIPDEEKENVMKIFGIDFDERAVRVARTLNLIAGDGETNVLHLNTLDHKRWDEVINDDVWQSTYSKGFRRMLKLRKNKNDYEKFNFDVLMANPPFAGDIKESVIINSYDLGYQGKEKIKEKVGRDILFIERNLDFVRPGGRLAIVLPQGRFNNTSDAYIRSFIAEHARILAVVGLDTNTFKPHTGTKTSVIFLQKWTDDKSKSPNECPRVENYPIFFAVSEKSGKNNSGDYVYLKDEFGKKCLDKFGHFIVEHDLHNHDDALPSGIAEAFAEWAESENLSFVMDNK